MAKTYPDIGTFSSGDILTATTMNEIGDNLDNQRVPPMCILNGGLQTINNATPTALTFASEVVDTDDMHNNSSNTSRITIKTAGVYVFTCQAGWAGQGADGSRILCILNKNGTEVNSEGARVDIGNYGASTPISVSLSLIVTAAVNDYFEWSMFQSSGGSRNVNGSTFAASWLGQAS